MFRLTVILILVLAGCSAPRKTTKRAGMLTGEETARRAGEETRKAEKEGNTGALIGSSSDREQPLPTEPEEETPEPASVSVLVGDGWVKSGDEEIDATKYFEKVAAENPKTAVTVQAALGAPYEQVVAVMDAAKSAGLDNIMLAAPPEELPPAKLEAPPMEPVKP